MITFFPTMDINFLPLKYFEILRECQKVVRAQLIDNFKAGKC